MKYSVFCLGLILFSFTTFSQSPGNDLHFDGVNDYVSCSLPTVFTDIANNDITLEAWVKPNAGAFQRIVYAQYTTSLFFNISLSATNQIYAYVYDGSSYGMNTSTTLPNAQWSHIAVTWHHANDSISVYINGQIQAIVNGGGSSSGTNNLMTIGSRPDGNQYYSGEIDEVRIWDYARSACDILSAMNSDFDTTQAGLVAYFQFNEGTAGGTNTSVTTLPDFTGTYNGTLNNFALTGSTSNWLASGATITQTNASGAVTTLIIDSICPGGYHYFGGDTLYAAGIYIDSLYSLAGCDSLVTLDLSEIHVDTLVTVNGFVLTANDSTASYQWLDCNNAYAVIPGETGQSYTALQNGSYAVEINNGLCTDTSSCHTISGVGISELAQKTMIYPNPTNGVITIEFLNNESEIYIDVLSADGRMVNQTISTQNKTTIDLQNEAAGIYIVKIREKNEIHVSRIIIQ
ncbi:MAG: hypothetical protein C0592_00730 [Marinilabiliales bacterium]|nr:MAG: hypothetical protein C0592_00730 [Marinilabiliales bacterium]